MAHSVPPAGSTPASAYSLDTSRPPELPPAILADAIGTDGEYLSLLKSATIAEGMTGEALGVHRGTGAAVRSLGHQFRLLTHIEDQTEEVVATMVRETFAPAVEAGVLSLVSTTLEVDESDPSQLNAVILIRDKLGPRSDQERRIVFPLPST